MHREPPRQRFIVAIGLGGIDHVVAIIDPVAHKLLDQIRRMLAVAVHEQHRAAAGMVQSGHQRGFLAEIARQRHDLDIEPIGCEGARDAERCIRAAVVDIDDFAAKAVTLSQRLCQPAEPLVQQRKPGRLVVRGHDDRQPLRRSIGRSGR